jgi:hypothetical protein
VRHDFLARHAARPAVRAAVSGVWPSRTVVMSAKYLELSLNTGVMLMTLIKNALPAIAVAAGLTAAILGLGAPLTSAEPAPPPPAPVQGDPPPDWAPRKPAEVWNGQPVVWNTGWGGRWGVWINGGFIPLSSNPVTGGG